MTKKDDLIPASPDYAEAKDAPPPDDTVFFSKKDPFDLFEDWLGEAKRKEVNDANAMSLATADASGLPDVRMVLLKGVDEQGFVFYTNTTSAKGQELSENPQAALCFHWKSIRRQVRVRGQVENVSDAEADEYFASRARDSRIGAWASDQSSPMHGRFELEKSIAKYAAKHAIGDIPRPPHWTGYRVIPQRIEFWRDRPFRLHDRLEFTRGDASMTWETRRLFP